MRKLIALAGLALILECVRLAPKPPRGMPADRLIAALRGRLPVGRFALEADSRARRPNASEEIRSALPYASVAAAGRDTQRAQRLHHEEDTCRAPGHVALA
jgi:hypothetical protein